MSDEDRSGAGEAGKAPARTPRRSRAEASLGMAKPRPDGRPSFSQVEVTAGIASLFWVIVVTLILVFARTEESVTGGSSGFDGLRFVMAIIAVFLPVALIWVAAITFRWAKVMQEESRRLQAAVDAIRSGYLDQAQTGPGTRPALERRLDELARAQKRSEEVLARIAELAGTGGGSADAPSAEPEAEPRLALPEAEAAPEPLPADILISALNFPESPEDQAGFRALRRALQHPSTGQLVQAAQDVLTLLSQDGIYMDDMSPDRAHPDLWRRFASGQRGGPITELGGIRDKAALAQVGSRMRQDTIFRDAVHHFLRKFDQLLTGFIPGASDGEVAAMTDTRSARAFMLLGRVAGAFD